MSTKPLENKNLLDQLGQAVKAARVAKGLKQSDVTQACGLSQNIVTNLEKGKGTTVSSLLSILEHLGLSEAVLAAIQPQDKEPVHDARFRPAEPKLVNENDFKLNPDALFASEDTVMTLPETLKRDELDKALERDPNSIYRVSNALATTLYSGASRTDIAVHSRICRFEAAAGERKKECFFVTSLENAKTLKLLWSVDGCLMKPNAIIQAAVSKVDLADHDADELLVVLRKRFAAYDIFVDSVIVTEKETMLKVGEREVRGLKYKELYLDTLQNWGN